MRLFKRYTTDTSPQLVSAVPISQDVTTTNNAESNTTERSEEKSKTEDNKLDDILSIKEDTQKESMDSSILTRKGKNIIKLYIITSQQCACILCATSSQYKKIFVFLRLSVIYNNKVEVNF